MKYLAPFFAFAMAHVTVAYAAPKDFVGSFAGTEKTTVTYCGNYNGTTTGPWAVTNSHLNGKQFKGNGSDIDGRFTATGSISGNTASGTTKGVNKWGQPWSARFSATLDGNDYTVTTTGSVPASGCKFSSVAHASRK